VNSFIPITGDMPPLCPPDIPDDPVAAGLTNTLDRVLEQLLGQDPTGSRLKAVAKIQAKSPSPRGYFMEVPQFRPQQRAILQWKMEDLANETAGIFDIDGTDIRFVFKVLDPATQQFKLLLYIATI
jgi:hypothetical protein